MTSVVEKIPAQWRQAGLSFLRVFAAACVASYLSLHKGISEVTSEDLSVVLNAGVAALGVTVTNALGTWDTRFGRGAQ